MTILVPSFDDAIVVREADAEVLGLAQLSTRLLADSDATGGALSIMRTTMREGVEGARPHTHSQSAELFYILDGQVHLLAGDQVLTASTGDLVIVPPNMAHAFATPAAHSADFLIVQAPGLARFGYFRLVERLNRGEATLEELLASQDLYDNHFLESPVWRAARGESPERVEQSWRSSEQQGVMKEGASKSLAGTWNISIATPVGTQSFVLELTEREGVVEGIAKGNAETTPLITPILDGNRLTWKLSITKPVRLTLTFDVTIHGDTLTGTAKAGLLLTSKVMGARA